MNELREFRVKRSGKHSEVRRICTECKTAIIPVGDPHCESHVCADCRNAKQAKPAPQNVVQLREPQPEEKRIMAYDREAIARVVSGLERDGKAYAQIALALNNLGHKTATGLEWNKVRLMNFKVTEARAAKRNAQPAQNAMLRARKRAANPPPLIPAPGGFPSWATDILRSQDLSAEKKVRVLLAYIE